MYIMETIVMDKTGSLKFALKRLYSRLFLNYLLQCFRIYFLKIGKRKLLKSLEVKDY